MDREIAKVAASWRRQIVFLRIINSYSTIGSGVYLVLISFELVFFLYKLPQSEHVFNFSEHPFLAGFLIFPLLMSLPGIYHFRSMLRSELPSTRLKALDDLGSKVLSQVRPRIDVSPATTVELRVLQGDGPLVSIGRRHRKIILSFHPDIAALVLYRPETLGAFLAHEITHSLQWDTSLGYIWCSMSIVGPIIVAVLGGVVIVLAIILGIAGRLIWGPDPLQGLAVALTGELVCLGIAAAHLMVRRWMEYSADMSTILAGYDSQMITLLTLDETCTNRWWLRRLFSSYPTRAERLQRLETILRNIEKPPGFGVDEVPDDIMREHTKIRPRDYGPFLLLVSLAVAYIVFTLVIAFKAAQHVTVR